MIKSTVYKSLAWLVLIVGFFLGFFAGFSVYGLLKSTGQNSNSGSVFIFAMLVTWLMAFIIALILFYLSASLYHLEKINNNTSRLIELSESNQPIRIAAQTDRIIHDGKFDVNV